MSEINKDLIISDVKRYLDITWEDDNTDKKITGIVNRGIKFLNDKAGDNLDYATEDRPKELLMEYCKYVRNGMLNEFMINYAPFLQDLRVKNGGVYGQSTEL